MEYLTIDDLLELQELAKVEDTRPEFLLDFPYAGEGIYYNFLYILSRKLDPQMIVELGVSSGAGVAHFINGGLNATYWGVDIDLSNKPEKFTVSKGRVSDRVNFLLGDSLEFAKHFLHFKDDKIDLLFIDTEHVAERCLKEYRTYLLHMSKGGIVLFDDIFMEGMSGVWEHIAEPKIILPDVHGSLGFGAAIVS